MSRKERNQNDYHEMVKDASRFAKRGKEDKASRAIQDLIDAAGQGVVKNTNAAAVLKDLKDGKFRDTYPYVGVKELSSGKGTEIVPDIDSKGIKRYRRVRFTLITILITAVIITSSILIIINEEHPVESISLDYSGGTLYPGDDLVTVNAGIPFTLEAVVSPSDATDRTLKWFSSFDDVRLTQDGSHLSVLIGPTASTGDILTITARSTTYDKSASLSFKVSNNIALTFDKSSSSIGLGESVTVSCTSNVPDLSIVPLWSIDSDLAMLETDGSTATVTVGYEAQKGDNITLTATVPDTNISQSVVFTIGESVGIDLEAISGFVRSDDGSMVVDAGIPFIIEAQVKPSTITDGRLVWSSNQRDSIITADGDSVTIMLGPSVRTGDSVTVTAKSTTYGIEQSISFEIENSIVLHLSAPSSSVRAGDSIDFVCSCSVPDLNAALEWSVDADWAALLSDGWNATIRVGDLAKKGDAAIVSACIPGTSISATISFTVSEGLILSLFPEKNVVNVQESPVFVVNASIQPSVSAGVFLKWEVLDSDSNPVDYASFTTSSSDPSIGFNDIIMVSVSDDAEDGVVLIIRATIRGEEISESVPISVDNEATRSIPVSTVDDLLSMKGSVAHFILQNSIDLGGIQWTPFQFDGTLDGDGRMISGLDQIVSYRTDSGLYHGGLFSINNGTIRNLVLDRINITVAPDNLGCDTIVYAGVVCGINNGVIEDVKIASSTILAHSTNIKTSWLSTHKSIPSVASGEANSGSWFDYASLAFTGTMVNDGWGEGTRMNVLAGGIAGLNNGSITGCVVTTNIDAEVINFCTGSSSGTTDVKDALVYAGGISGRNTAEIASCTTHGKVKASLVLHDSGDGSGAGLGYFTATFSPKANGFIGGITGYSVDEVAGASDCSIEKNTEVFAPGYAFGPVYNINKGNPDNIQWFEGSTAGATA